MLIDGRNTYTRTFAGTYWENQDVMLEDVERIEVVRGPGATLWGANAVNGVINIITKHTSKTQGGLLAIGGGTEKQGFGTLRYGGELNDNTTARAYIKGFKIGENHHQTGNQANDDWSKVQGGFKMDSQLTTQDNLTIQGDIYRGSINQNTTRASMSAPYSLLFGENINTYGGNLLIHQKHTFSSTSDYSLQVFYSHNEYESSTFKERRHSIDIDFNHRFSLLNWNDIIWGASYRYSNNNLTSPSPSLSIHNSNRNDHLFSAFIQNEITLVENSLWLTLGSKFEHNDYSGFEVQPNARVMWIPHLKHRLWAAVSKAVRTPSRLEQDSDLLVFAKPPEPPATPVIAFSLASNPQFDSENVISYELGYRTTWIDNVSIDLTAFYNSYTNLSSVSLNNPVFDPEQGALLFSTFFENNQKAQTYGFEIATVWQMLDWWRWDANYSLLKTNFEKKEGLGDDSISPQQRVSLRSSLSPWQNIKIDFIFRYVGENKAVNSIGSSIVDDYASLDIRLAWQPINNLELSLVGQNLLADHHLEYIQESFTSPTEIDRGVYGKLVWNF